ncbi:tail fiber protein [Photorhabdus luminescens]|uniref:tail fiber protein n=1 Tax=Photorhabdus luminescens TaxID=29488 RepID=UPI00159EDD6A|nr:tail fiber protein [Photorhabdus luminescens]
MEKKNDLSNSAINPENTDNKAETPSADDLKKRFKAGSIPLQIDYEHLIDIADIGRKATGQAPQQKGPGAGLKLDDNGALNLKIGAIASKDYSPLILKDDILSVDLGSGLINKDNGISVGQGNGIVINTDNVSVKAKDKGGITVDGDGVSVKSNNGINIDNNGVSVKAKDQTISVEPTGISVKLGWGVKVGGGLDVKASNGINVDSSGVSVKAGNGISVSGNGVEVKAKNNGSISVDSEGIAVKCWKGGGIVVTDDAGLYLKLEEGNSNNAWSGTSGLSLSEKGVKVKAGKGIKVGGDGVSIIPDTTTGIMITKDGLGIYLGDGLKCDYAGAQLHVKAGNGINVNSNGVSVNIEAIASAIADLIIPAGTIVPFYSSGSVPNGWVLCDGRNGTPNLNNDRDKGSAGWNISLISGWDQIRTDYWNLGYGEHLKANVYFMRYIMKKKM